MDNTISNTHLVNRNNISKLHEVDTPLVSAFFLMNIHQQRQNIRRKRRLLPPTTQKIAEQETLKKIRYFSKFKNSKNIGLYLDAFGEVKTKQLIQLCFKLKKNVYLPKISNLNQKLEWVKITSSQFYSAQFSQHTLGMKQPMNQRGKSIHHLDLLILPLVICDIKGTRIGMGGGYYDRSLAQATVAPFRLGLAHDFQLLNTILKRESWDQPIDAVCTPQHFLIFKN